MNAQKRKRIERLSFCGEGYVNYIIYVKCISYIISYISYILCVHYKICVAYIICVILVAGFTEVLHRES